MQFQPSTLSDDQSTNLNSTQTVLPTNRFKMRYLDFADYDYVMEFVSLLIYTRIALGCIVFIIDLVAIRIFWLITSDKAPPVYVFMFGLSVARSMNCFYSIYTAFPNIDSHKVMRSDIRFLYYSISSHFLSPLDETAETVVVWLLVMASVERAQHYFGPRGPCRKCFRKRHACLKILIWMNLFAFAFNICRFFQYRLVARIQNPNYPENMSLIYYKLFPQWYNIVYSTILDSTVNMFLPYVLLIILNMFNGIGAWRARESTGGDGDQQIDKIKQRWLTVTVVISGFSFVLLTMPYHVVHWLWYVWDWDDESSIPFEYLVLFYAICKLILLFNIVVSVIIYVICLADFRRKFFEITVSSNKWSRELAGRFRRRFLPGHDMFGVEYRRCIDGEGNA